ncbi:MAG: hypothetical protein AAF826_07265 [Pseudomonadota bacterium]
MNWFDNLLSRLEILTKIAFGGILSFVVAYAGLQVQWQDLGLKKATFCIDRSEVIKKVLADEDQANFREALTALYAEQCGVTPKEAEVELNEKTTQAELRETPNSNLGDIVSAERDKFVVLGYLSSSFGFFSYLNEGDGVLSTPKKPVSGDKLVAVANVNIRTNTDVTGPKNPIIGQIKKGRCVRALGSTQQLRSLYWLKIEEVDC